MAVIEVEAEIRAPIGRVWEVVSDIDGEPKYWKGTKEVRNISKDGNRVTREVTIAFRDQKCMQLVTLTPPEAIVVEFTAGIIDGKKTVSLRQEGGSTMVRTVWDIRLTGMMGMFTGMLKGHIRNGTEQALGAIKREIEG